MPETRLLVIRKAQSEDEATLFALARSFATSFVVEEQPFSHSLSEILSSSDACLVVAEDEGQIVGYALAFDHFTFYANGRVTWVEEIVVSETFRRQGVGRRLMQEIEAWAVRRGSRLVALATRRASAFYQALGYEESALYFRKRLSIDIEQR